MAKSLNNDVLSKVDEIVSHIKNSNSYKKYQEITEKMQKDQDIMNNVRSVKKIQKEIVKLQYEKRDYSQKEKEIADILELLNTYPIYQEYTYLLEDLNNTFQEIRIVIEKYLNEKLK